MNKNTPNDSTRHYIAFLSRKYSAITQSSQKDSIGNHVLIKSSVTSAFIATTESDKKDPNAKAVT